jgi:hypothetical protein
MGVSAFQGGARADADVLERGEVVKNLVWGSLRSTF